MSPKDMILLAAAVPFFVAVTALIVASTVALYLEVIRPHLARIHQEKREKKQRAKKMPITGINFSMDIERAGKVKGESTPEMQYRRQA